MLQDAAKIVLLQKAIMLDSLKHFRDNLLHASVYKGWFARLKYLFDFAVSIWKKHHSRSKQDLLRCSRVASSWMS